MYSAGAMNSIVLELTSGRRVTSPYDLLAGSYWNSSGTIENVDKQERLDSVWPFRLAVLSSLTFVYPETKIALPFLAIDEIDEWIDVCSACTASYNRCTLNDWQILFEDEQIYNESILAKNNDSKSNY